MQETPYMRLEALQASMIAAIDLGPEHVADKLFLGGRQAALRGLSVHANTISHARLVALEETFPRTRALLGEARFNRLSRAYVETPEAKARPLNAIGRGFARFLSEADARSDAGSLAAFEWAWLESYHAAEAEALKPSHFADANEDTLLSTVVRLHPAALLITAQAAPMLAEEIPALAGAEAILLTRPGAEVLLTPADRAMQWQYAMLGEAQRICNLLDLGNEFAGEDGLQGVMTMLGAGSLVLTSQA